MSENSNIYKLVATTLMIMNFVSIFFIFALILWYSALEYVGLTVIDISNQLLVNGGFWQNAIINIFNLTTNFPEQLDNLFMAIIFLAIMNLFYLSYKLEKGGYIGLFFFLSIGLPLWVFLTSKIVEIRNQFIDYLNTVYVIYPSHPFWDWYNTYNLEASAVIFIVAIIINMVDWENIREKLSPSTDISDTTTLNERFQQ